MKRLLLAILLCVSLSAQSADIVLRFSAGELNRFQTALGEQRGLVDNQTPPQPRDATLQEVKQFFLQRAHQVIVDSKGVAALYKKAADAVVLPVFAPTAP